MPKLEYGEFKGEYKGDSDSSRDRRADDAKGTDDGNVKVNATLERGELLMYVADEANSKLLGPNARLSKFVGKYTPEWEVAVEGEVLSIPSYSPTPPLHTPLYATFTPSMNPPTAPIRSSIRRLYRLITPSNPLHDQRDGSGSPMKMMSRWKGIHGDYMDLMEVGPSDVAYVDSFFNSCVDHGLLWWSHGHSCLITPRTSPTPLTPSSNLQHVQEELGGLVRKNGGTMERFLVDAKHALDGGEGFLFDDENYRSFPSSSSSSSSGPALTLYPPLHPISTPHSEFIDFVNAIADFEAFHELMMKECRKVW